MKATLHRSTGRWLHVLLAAIALITLVVSWGQWSRISENWRWLLPIGTVAVGLGILALVQRRERLAGIAMVVAAMTLLTGYAFILNACLIVLALPLILRPAASERA